MRTLPTLAISLLLAVCASAESYHLVTIGDLGFAPDDQPGLKEKLASNPSFWSNRFAPRYNLRLPAEVEAYIRPGSSSANPNRQRVRETKNLQVALRFTNDQPISGFIDLADRRLATAPQPFAISLDPQKLKPTTKEEFEKIRRDHYAHLASFQTPGRTWFQHRAAEQNQPNNRRRQRRDSELSETFAMFSGGRALSENLALDRELILGTRSTEPEVPLSEIEGVTVKAIDWKDRLPEAPVKVDALATAIPLDQHALFLPSTDELFQLVDLFESEGAPVLGTFETRNPFTDLLTTYLKKLGLGDRAAISALPVKSVAVTGGDPFFPSGTDIAILLEFENPEAAKDKLPPSATTLGNAIVLTNSPVQLQRLQAVHSGKTPSLGASEEFQFFRHRYPLNPEGADAESAFAFLSDATIRRWASPRFRIAASRRTRAMAALAGLTAEHIDTGKISDRFQPLLGKVQAPTEKNTALTSEKFGTLSSITPISHLQFDTVTKNEKTAYERWKRGYESGWAQVFDPIAIRLTQTETSRQLDLSIIPLTIDSQYRNWIATAGKSALTPMARNPHDDALFFASFAIDSDSATLGQLDVSLGGLMPGLKIKPLGWLGESITVFFEDGPLWDQINQPGAPSFDPEFIHMLPLGIRVESKSSIKLALFLGAIKGLAETSSPGLVNWETRKHGDKPYVAIIGNGDQIGADISIYYATTPKAWLLSLDEDILKKAIDREAGIKQLDPTDLPTAKHAFLDTSPQFLTTLSRLADNISLLQQRRQQSYSALHILNEWHRLHPDKDPAAFHRQTFAEPITCPGGKGYQWNAPAMTMESVAFGHPAAPRDDSLPLTALEKFNALAGGLGFEDDGLQLWLNLSEMPSE